MIRTDHHMHTKYCRHASGDAQEYAKNAEEKGLEYVGFSGHLPLPDGFNHPDKSVAMAREDLPRYIDDVQQARENSGMQIATGAEADFLPGYEKQTAKALKKNGFDFTIGSVHFIQKWNFDHTEEGFREGLKRYDDPDAAYREYYALVKKMVESKMFDIAGHLDLIKKFGYAPKDKSPDVIGEILDRAKKNRMAIEVNTAGIDKITGEIYPSEQILRMCLERDLEVTVGSDAHAPDQVGRHFEKAEELLKRVGYTSIVTFYRRKKGQVQL